MEQKFPIKRDMSFQRAWPLQIKGKDTKSEYGNLHNLFQKR